MTTQRPSKFRRICAWFRSPHGTLSTFASRVFEPGNAEVKLEAVQEVQSMARKKGYTRSELIKCKEVPESIPPNEVPSA